MLIVVHVNGPINSGKSSVSTKNKDLKVADDGSLTIYVQASAPTNPDQRDNWLTAPKGDFSLYVRASRICAQRHRALSRPAAASASTPRVTRLVEPSRMSGHRMSILTSEWPATRHSPASERYRPSGHAQRRRSESPSRPQKWR